MADRYKCPCCKGRGTMPLTGIYAETLRDVRRWCARPERHVVANRDAWWFGCSPTALNNRLAWLEEHSFIKSEKYGRQRRFFVDTGKNSGRLTDG
jgi:response regulator of citrate/malate metabolism